MRLGLRYGYFKYTDQLTAGSSNYEAHMVYSTLSYRF